MSASLVHALTQRATDIVHMQPAAPQPSPGALLHATLLGDFDAVCKLLERGASSDAASPQALETALQAAAKGGRDTSIFCIRYLH